ncbi:MAG: peptidoglycan DD-metalloendopeptidase family protein [Bacilli bacterium]|nr:peptidoglycan DD-metalloendopeptidase family protein [Bacilli bacterium]
MMKKITVLLILILIVSLPIFQVSAKEETLGDLRKAYEALLQEQKENDAKTEAAKREEAAKEQAKKEAEENLSKARKEEADTQEKIDESNVKIGELKASAEKTLAYLQQMKSQNAYVEYVTGASTMTDLITRIAAIEQVTKSIQDTLTSLEEEIKTNEKLKLELQEKQKALDSEIKKYQAAIQKIHQNIEEYDKFALGLPQKIQVAKDLYEAEKKTCQETIGKTSDDVVISTCTNTQIPHNYGWLKPLNRGVITSEVGTRWGEYHNALDIGGNAEGTPVYAAAAGKVTGKISKYRCGGNMLYIDVVVGGVTYTTYYYHLLKFNVNVGDIVTQNTIIGWVGGGSTSTANGGYDGCTFGAHLHFGVAKGRFTGTIQKSNVITPPGFPNQYGWRFNSRTDYWG